MLCRGRIQKGGFFRLFVLGLALASDPRSAACDRRKRLILVCAWAKTKTRLRTMLTTLQDRFRESISRLPRRRVFLAVFMARRRREIPRRYRPLRAVLRNDGHIEYTTKIGCIPGSTKKKWGEVCQVAAPDHPGVGAGSFDVHVSDGFRGEPGSEIAIEFDQLVGGAAGDPEQMELLIGFGVERGKFFVEFGRDAAGAESANPGKFIQSIQAGEQRFRAAHGETGDSAGVAVLFDKICRFHLRDNFAEQSLAKFIEVALRDFATVEDAGVWLENFCFAVSERHDDNHGFGFALGDEIVQDDVGAPDCGPATGIVTEAVQEI